MAERDGIGGNNPPLSEVLKDQYAALLADAEKWTSAAARAPATVDDDAALGKFGTLVTNLNKIAREAEAKRKTEKQPHLDAGRTVDGFFGGIMGKINDVVAALEARQKVYIKAKERKARDEAERQQAAAAETAAAALRAAERAQDKGKFDEADALLGEAAAAETAAVAAGEKAEAKTADLVRTHADSGAVVSAKKILGVRAFQPRRVRLRHPVPLGHARAVYLGRGAVEGRQGGGARWRPQHTGVQDLRRRRRHQQRLTMTAVIETRFSDTFIAFASALATAQGEIEPATKNRANTHFKTKYADLTEIVEACRQPLAKAQIARLQVICYSPDGTWLETWLIHGPSGEYFMGRFPIEASRKSQELGAAITYAKRFSLAAMVGVVSEDEDDDGESITERGDGETAATADGPSGAERSAQAKADQWSAMAVRAVDAIAASGTFETLQAWEANNQSGLTRMSRFKDAHGRVMAALNAAAEKLAPPAV